jgi:hypothetical protein
MSDDNPYDGILRLGNSPTWQGNASSSAIDLLATLKSAIEAEIAAPAKPDWSYAWCSRCGVRGYSTVFGDQAEWHECEARQ